MLYVRKNEIVSIKKNQFTRCVALYTRRVGCTENKIIFLSVTTEFSFHKKKTNKRNVNSIQTSKQRKRKTKIWDLGLRDDYLHALALVSAVAVVAGRHGDGWIEIEREEI